MWYGWGVDYGGGRLGGKTRGKTGGETGGKTRGETGGKTRGETGGKTGGKTRGETGGKTESNGQRVERGSGQPKGLSGESQNQKTRIGNHLTPSLNVLEATKAHIQGECHLEATRRAHERPPRGHKESPREATRRAHESPQGEPKQTIPPSPAASPRPALSPPPPRRGNSSHDIPITVNPRQYLKPRRWAMAIPMSRHPDATLASPPLVNILVDIPKGVTPIH
ncbi:hypothetical protein VC83_01543 [Pseudogymnoascus destructans]|uniref:Uncharacterized protein n=1 Tax=Pseudogymnoascus destructans TaxID=655981 RepID=A0A177AL16_9PEZI|nr:uncharacterized protein VC83_01543 [Pseudogymnoascus destructans]OAF61963.1 hypothetical protein VC83_01543 [Pseudogymnoascus destructans]